MPSVGLRVLCISDPKPSVLFGGRNVSFYQIDGVGMVEMLEQNGADGIV